MYIDFYINKHHQRNKTPQNIESQKNKWDGKYSYHTTATHRSFTNHWPSTWASEVENWPKINGTRSFQTCQITDAKRPRQKKTGVGGGRLCPCFFATWIGGFHGDLFKLRFILMVFGGNSGEFFLRDEFCFTLVVVLGGRCEGCWRKLCDELWYTGGCDWRWIKKD